MIFYRPTDGDVPSGPINWQPRSCFVMSAMGRPVPEALARARKRVDAAIGAAGFRVKDASSVTTGKDYLLKIWSLAVCAPVGVAIVHDGIRADTMANVFYELGLMHAYGRETVVVKVGGVQLPSDLVRTEYIELDRAFAVKFAAFMASLDERADYYLTLADQLEKNPLLAIDYLRRSYLLSGDKALERRARNIFAESGFAERARDSVEHNLVRF
jgi:methylmalonyl-CoA mutase cobalamin-binding subunit